MIYLVAHLLWSFASRNFFCDNVFFLKEDSHDFFLWSRLKESDDSPPRVISDLMSIPSHRVIHLWVPLKHFFFTTSSLLTSRSGDLQMVHTFFRHKIHLWFSRLRINARYHQLHKMGSEKKKRSLSLYIVRGTHFFFFLLWKVSVILWVVWLKTISSFNVSLFCLERDTALKTSVNEGDEEGRQQDQQQQQELHHQQQTQQSDFPSSHFLTTRN